MKHKIFHYQQSDVAYWEFHPEGKTTIVMLHGFRGTHHGMQDIIDALPGYRVIVPDLPGFGASAPLDRHTISDFVQFTRAFLRSVAGRQQIILFGHSLGSVIASYTAAEYPDLVRCLILVNPIPTPALQGANRLATHFAFFYHWLGDVLPERVGQAFLTNQVLVRVGSELMTKTKDADLRRYVHARHRKYMNIFHDRHSLREIFRTSASHGVADVAERLTMPTLLIVGERDYFVPLRDQYALLAQLRNGQLVSIPGVGHIIHYETPVQAAKVITQFLSAEEVLQKP